jgi:hypothetical protein
MSFISKNSVRDNLSEALEAPEFEVFLLVSIQILISWVVLSSGESGPAG